MSTETLSQAPQNQKDTGTFRKFLIFTIRDTETSHLKLGVDVSYVMDILDSYDLTYLPMVPHYIQGVFNLRGQIIPVMDLHSRLGKPSTEEKGLLIVLEYNHIQLAIIVDEVDRIIEIDESTIVMVHSQEFQRFTSGMCNIPGNTGTMLVLNCEELFSHK